MNDIRKEKLPSNLNQSVWDSCEIIKYLTGRDWCRLKDISLDLDMEQTRVHRLLNTLAAHDFIQYNQDTHQYRLGFQFYTVAYRMSRDSVISVAKPHLEFAAGELYETINFGMLARDKAKLIHVFRLDGTLSADYDDVPLGVSRYTHESALGKVILAHLPYGEQQSVLSRLVFQKYTENSFTSKEQLEEELMETRQRGYAIDNGEITPECFCVAMPVYDGTKRVIAAVSVSMREKPSPKKMEKVLKILQATTKRISNNLR